MEILVSIAFHYSSSEEIIVEHHNFITLKTRKELIIMRFLLQGDKGHTFSISLT